MVEFRSDNGKYGVQRIARTPTGYKGLIYSPKTKDGEEEASILMFTRGVDDEGAPYIEIDVSNVDEADKALVREIIMDALQQKGFAVNEVPSPHGSDHLTLVEHHNSLNETFSALLEANLPDGTPIIPDIYKDFVLEQQQVRNSLEQSLLHAFGEDCFSNKKGGPKPRNENNRIQRLAHHFREGLQDEHGVQGEMEG